MMRILLTLFGGFAGSALLMVQGILVPWDENAHHWVVVYREGHPWITLVMRFVTRLGDSPISWIVTSACLVWLCVALRRTRAALAVGLAVLLATSTGMLWKANFARPRPPVEDRWVTETSSSFPSGHSVFISALGFGMLALGGSPRYPNPSVGKRVCRYAIIFLVVGLIGIVGFSRFWLGVHYPADIIAGWSWGAFWVTVLRMATDAYDTRSPTPKCADYLGGANK